MGSVFPYRELTMVILAGGRGKRMGQDKALLAIGDTTFVKKLVQLGEKVAQTVLISAGRQNAGLFTGLGVTIIPDIEKDKGPLAGIVSVLPHIATDWFLLISVDSPLVDSEVVETLWTNKNGRNAVIFSDGTKTYPLLGLYHLSTKDTWDIAWAQNRLRISGIVKTINPKTVVADMVLGEKIKNINTRKEYTEWIEK